MMGMVTPVVREMPLQLAAVEFDDFAGTLAESDRRPRPRDWSVFSKDVALLSKPNPCRWASIAAMNVRLDWSHGHVFQR
jgi:hypothetical protein